MDLNQYQIEAMKTAAYPDVGPTNIKSLIYPALGIADEAGEVAGKVKKILRDKQGVMTIADQAALKKELGDVLWYVAVCADAIGCTLEEVARANVLKLSDRQQRGVLGGDGDDR